MMIKKNNIKTVFFDAGGILFTTRIPFNERVRTILKSLNVEEKIIENAIQKGNEYFSQYRDSGKWLNNWSEEKIYFEKYYSVIANEVNSNNNYLSERLFHLTHYVNHCTLYPEVIDVLESLSKHYKLSVISNALPSLDWVFDKLQIRKYFDSITISAFVCKAKPDEIIYRKALENSHSNSEESLFIDNKYANVEAAKNVGMEGAHIDRSNGENLNIVKDMLI